MTALPRRPALGYIQSNLESYRVEHRVNTAVSLKHELTTPFWLMAASLCCPNIKTSTFVRKATRWMSHNPSRAQRRVLEEDDQTRGLRARPEELGEPGRQDAASQGHRAV